MTTTTRPHPVYVKATQDGWIDTADQAKLIRSTLAARFPGVRFYVRLERFAGGSAIDIYYDGLAGYEPLRACYCATGPTVRDYNSNQCSKCDYIGRLEPIYKPGAPTRRDVEAITDPYRGGSFDGTIDLGYSVQSWLLPDGRAVHGRSPGTVESRGLDPAYEHPRPEPGAVLVHFSAHFVHVHDEMPYGSGAHGMKRCAHAPAPILGYALTHALACQRCGRNLYWRADRLVARPERRA